MKFQTDACQMDRTRPARKILLRKTSVRHGAIAESAKLHVLNAQRTLKGLQFELSVPELHERQADLRENQSLEFYHRRKARQPVIKLVDFWVAEACMGESIFPILRKQEGWWQQSFRFRSEHRDDRRNRFLRWDAPSCGYLACGYLATHKHSERQNKAFVHHEISRPSNSRLPLRRRRNGLPASKFLSLAPWIGGQDFALRGTGLL